MEHDLLEFVKRGDVQQLRTLLAGSQRLARFRDDQGISAILTALYHGHQTTAILLAEFAGPLDLFEASALGRLARTDQLLDEQPNLINDFSPDGFTALHLAGFFARPEVVTTLLTRGAEVSLCTKNPMKLYPINSAAAGGSTEAVAALLDAGSPVDACQHGGVTPLMSAAANGNGAMVDLLLERGANKARRSDTNQVAADYANQRGHQNLLPA